MVIQELDISVRQNCHRADAIRSPSSGNQPAPGHHLASSPTKWFENITPNLATRRDLVALQRTSSRFQMNRYLFCIGLSTAVAIQSIGFLTSVAEPFTSQFRLASLTLLINLLLHGASAHYFLSLRQ